MHMYLIVLQILLPPAMNWASGVYVIRQVEYSDCIHTSTAILNGYIFQTLNQEKCEAEIFLQLIFNFAVY
jgi:hypothetical protein